MHGQTIAQLDEQAKVHRNVTKNMDDDITAYKTYVQGTFTQADNYVKLKVGELESAINIGVDDTLNGFTEKIKFIEASLGSLTSFVHHTGQQAYNIASEQQVAPAGRVVSDQSPFGDQAPTTTIPNSFYSPGGPPLQQGGAPPGGENFSSPFDGVDAGRTAAGAGHDTPPTRQPAVLIPFEPA